MTTDRALATVTFLRLDRRPERPAVVLPPNMVLFPVRMDVCAYRELFDTIGAPYLWWMRRAMSDDTLRRHLSSPAVRVFVLWVDGKPAGFFELDGLRWPDMNLNYLGLVPEKIGQGLGRLLLDIAIDAAFGCSPGICGLTVNTSTADHPRALPNYLAAGFRKIREAEEIWDIPVRLGLSVPEHLRAPACC